MHHHYNDIVSRIKERPKWWDENAVPRYDEFTPNDTADIYCDEAVLLEIQCQDCGYHFKVAFSSDMYDRYHNASLRQHYLKDKGEERDIKELAREASLAWGVISNGLHYGDPPNACPPNCAAGATMNSVPLEVLEFWVKDKVSIIDWIRVPELERKIDCDWWPPEKGGT